MNRLRGLGRAGYFFVWPGLYISLLLSKRCRVVLLSGDSILLVRGMLSDGRYGLPGGGLHRGEHPANAAIREVREEVGIHLQPADLVALGSEWVQSQGLRFYCHFFAATVPAQSELKLQIYEIAEARWCTRDEVMQLPHRHEVDRALQMLADR